MVHLGLLRRVIKENMPAKQGVRSVESSNLQNPHGTFISIFVNKKVDVRFGMPWHFLQTARRTP